MNSICPMNFFRSTDTTDTTDTTIWKPGFKIKELNLRQTSRWGECEHNQNENFSLT